MSKFHLDNHPSHRGMFDIQEGPRHHLIDVDHEKLLEEKERIEARAREEARLLTMAWALFILPLFVYSMFEIVYLI